MQSLALIGTLGTLTLADTSGLNFNFSDANGTGTGTGSGDTTDTIRGTVADINSALDGLTFTPADNYPGLGSVAIITNDLGSPDSGGPLQADSIVTITDPPVNMVPTGAQTTLVNQELVFSAANGNAISIADPDIGSAAVQVTLTATEGTLTLSKTDNLTISAGTGTNDATMTIAGTVTDIDAAFDGLTFTPESDYHGSASVEILTNDLGDANAGASLTDNTTLPIAVNQTTPTVNWSDPASIVYGTAVSNSQLDATSGVSGTFAYSVSAGTGLNAGNYALTVTFTPNDTIDYATTTSSVPFTVSAAQVTVTADSQSMTCRGSVPTLTYTYNGLVNGDSSASFTGDLGTSATSLSPVNQYAINQGTLLATGNYTIGTFNPGVLTVNPATLTVTADPQSMTYGGSVPALTATITGYVNGDDDSVISGAPTLSTDATTSSGVNTYMITAGVGSLVASNYTFTPVSGTLTVNQATLTVTADPQSMTYGGSVPALTYTYTGLVNGDSSASFTGDLATSATSSSPVNQYAIVQGTLLATGNYTIDTFSNATLVVNPYAFSYAVHNEIQIYGTPANFATDLPAVIDTGVNGESLAIAYSSIGDTATGRMSGATTSTRRLATTPAWCRTTVSL